MGPPQEYVPSGAEARAGGDRAQRGPGAVPAEQGVRALRRRRCRRVPSGERGNGPHDPLAGPKGRRGAGGEDLQAGRARGQRALRQD